MSDAATTERVEQNLGAVPILSRLKRRDLKKLARLCVPRSFVEREVIIEEGATGLGLFVVTSGRVEVFKGQGSDRVHLGWMEEGDVIGEIALIDDQPRSASVVAQQPTECLLLTRDSFATLIEDAPEVAWCIVPSLAERVRELHAKVLKAETRSGFEERDDGQWESQAAVGEAEEPGGDLAAAANGKSQESEGAVDEASEAWRTMGRMMRLPYGLMVGGLAGMSSMTRLCENFFSNLAEETDLRDGDSLVEVLFKAPDGLVGAGRKAVTDLEDLPQDMVDGFRRVYQEPQS